MTNKMTTAEGNTTAATKEPASAHGGERQQQDPEGTKHVPQIDTGEYYVAQNGVETGRVVVSGTFPNTTEHWFLYTVAGASTGIYTVPSSAPANNVVTTTLSYVGKSDGINLHEYNKNLPTNTYIVATCVKSTP